MTDRTDSIAEQTQAPWPVLDVKERRILGVLVEKAKTTPDAYPLSVNALVTGSNQKTNRDPVMELSEEDVEETLARCLKKNLVARVQGGRVERWRQMLYEVWHVDKIDLAILTELLLRGPQTEGELRGRASRMETIDDLEKLREVLKPLVERKLVVYLTPEDRRGAILTHGFHAPEEFERLRRQAAIGGSSTNPGSTGSTGSTGSASSGKEHSERGSQALEMLETEMAALRQEVSRLARVVADLQRALGEPTT